jgi:hypothetical protein
MVSDQNNSTTRERIQVKPNAVLTVCCVSDSLSFVRVAIKVVETNKSRVGGGGGGAGDTYASY